VTAVGDRATDFTLADRDGQEHRLSDALAAGPVVLAFFKADCAACTLAFPYLERLALAHPTGVTVWGICQNPARAADWFARNTGVTFPLLIDREGLPVSRDYDPPATPTILLIAPDGSVRTGHHGFSKPELNALAARVAATLGDAPVEIAPADDGKPSFRPG
jgi:peroxiredoxin